MGGSMKKALFIISIVFILSSCDYGTPIVSTSDEVQYTTCPENYILVPANAEFGTNDFCVAKYEMKKVYKDDNSIDEHGNYIKNCYNPDDAINGWTAKPTTSWILTEKRSHEYYSCYEEYDSEIMKAVSRPDGIPWRAITRGGDRDFIRFIEGDTEYDGAIEVCRDLTNDDFEYHLIKNSEWQSIARNIEKNPLNWSKGKVGDGDINRGHNGTLSQHEFSILPASTDDDPNFGTLNNNLHKYKRTHTLSNGEVIWDFAGNALEFVYADLWDMSVSIKNKLDHEPGFLEDFMKNIYGSNGEYPTDLGDFDFNDNDYGTVLRGGTYFSGAGIYSMHVFVVGGSCSDKDNDWCMGDGYHNASFRCVAIPKVKKLKQ